MSAHARDLVEYVAKALAEEPDEVHVEERSGTPTVIALSLAPADLGRVIGRHGKTARALRTLLAARGQKVGQRINLEILD